MQEQNVTLDSLLNSIVNGEQDSGLNKEASEANISAADELQTLLNTNAGDQTEMNKVAAENTGKQIADGILSMLTKQAENAVQADINKMEQQHDARIELNPTQGNTVAEMAKAIMDRAASNGGAAAPATLADEVSAEGKAQDPALAAGPSDLSKQASEAVNLLVAEGATFDDAIVLVKQAQEELLLGNLEFEKAAAVNQLVAEGYDFADAAEMVKAAADELYGEPNLELEKAAAVDQLVAEGYDFADAAEMVKAAAAELYGEPTYSDLEKSAAVNQLVAEGLDFDTASELVKEAASVQYRLPDGAKKNLPARVANAAKKGLLSSKAAKIAAGVAGGAAAAGGAYAALRGKKD